MERPQLDQAHLVYGCALRRPGAQNQRRAPLCWAGVASGHEVCKKWRRTTTGAAAAVWLPLKFDGRRNLAASKEAGPLEGSNVQVWQWFARWWLPQGCQRRDLGALQSLAGPPANSLPAAMSTCHLVCLRLSVQRFRNGARTTCSQSRPCTLPQQDATAARAFRPGGGGRGLCHQRSPALPRKAHHNSKCRALPRHCGILHTQLQHAQQTPRAPSKNPTPARAKKMPPLRRASSSRHARFTTVLRVRVLRRSTK